MPDDKPICDDNENGGGDAEEEEEMVDPHDKLRDACKAKSECVKLFEKLTECNDRVNSRSKTTEVCAEEMVDFMHCVDHCAAKNLFKYLK